MKNDPDVTNARIAAALLLLDAPWRANREIAARWAELTAEEQDTLRSRVPEMVRASLAGTFDVLRDVLRSIADNPNAAETDREAARAALAKYGNGGPSA